MRGQSYQHILAAIDLGTGNNLVLQKAIALARTHAAKLSVIHIDMDVHNLYTDMIDIELDAVQDQVLQATRQKMEQVLSGLDFPIDKKVHAGFFGPAPAPDKKGDELLLYLKGG